MQIIVCHEKHGERYYDASTPEAWAKSALAILTDRFNDGYWYHDPRQVTNSFSLERRAKMYEMLLVTDEQIEAIPSDEARVVLRKQRRRARAEHQQELEQIEQYDRIKIAVEAQDRGFFTVGRDSFQIPVAWDILEDRSDHEYERVELEQVIT
jgi:hypothetical protein